MLGIESVYQRMIQGKPTVARVDNVACPHPTKQVIGERWVCFVTTRNARQKKQIERGTCTKKPYSAQQGTTEKSRENVLKGKRVICGINVWLHPTRRVIRVYDKDMVNSAGTGLDC